MCQGSDKEFVHLHVHSDYSLLDGACRMDRLMERAQTLGMKAIALTDHGNLFGTVDFFQTAKRYDIKPLVGCEVYLTYDHKRTERPDRTQHKYHHMGLISRNFKGYQNLTKLVSDAHINGLYYKPRTDMETLAKHAEGLIGFTGCLQGVVPQMLLKQNMAGARKAMGEFIDIFGREFFFVELQDHGISEQRQINPQLLKLAEEFKVKVICSNDVHYVQNQDWEPHDALLCIQTGTKISDEKRLRYASHQFYLKSRAEMEQLFKEVPQAVINTNAVAECCELQLPFGENHYPVFTLTPEIKSECPTGKDYLKQLCIKGLQDRYAVDYHNPDSAKDPEQAKTLVERLDYEIDTIERTGFIDYFLIVWDFIDWARKEGIPVGPGRGSGAGCIVAYVLKITDIDPIRFGLLFERFLNPERVSPPDFDIDFCMRRRGQVIEYVRKKYGEECVANIITFGTFGAKMVVRDVARVLDLPYAEGDRIAKMVPDDIGISLEEAIQKSSDLREEVKVNPVAAQIIEHGQVIEGMVRNTGTHAAGVIIADRPLTEFIPLTVQEGALTTQYPKDPVEQLGLLKMDFLGLKTLTIIADAEQSVRLTADPDFDIEKVPFEDDATFALLNKARTVGVFQLESSGMQSLCRQFKISNIDEIIALIALYRPGPMEWIPDYIKGKHDPSTVKYPHPLLEEICKETYGVMVYQEQVMEAARRIAGYTLGGADILRRAMGKKKPQEMAKQRKIFVDGAKEHNDIPKAKAEEIFNILEKFAGYGFNKSHSAAYAILAFRTGYLKANYPVAFMASVLSNELGNADKLSHFIDECVAMNIPVLGPHINFSREAFTPVLEEDQRSGSIRFGLGAIKGVGDTAAKKIMEERNANGNFEDFKDFVRRVDSRVVNKRVTECLIKSGAFDEMGTDRQHLLDSVDVVLSEAASLQKDQESGQGSLFDLIEEEVDDNDNAFAGTPLKTDGPVMTMREKLSHEKELLGFYISGHPMNDYREIATAVQTFQGDEYLTLPDRTPFRLCGVVGGLTKKLARRDNRPWAYFQLATHKDTYPVNIYSDSYEKSGHHLQNENLISITGTVFNKDGESRLSIQEVKPLEQSLPEMVDALCWVLAPTQEADSFLKELRQVLDREFGNTPVQVGFLTEDQKLLMADLAGSLTWHITGKSFAKLRQHPAVLDVRFKVKPFKIEEPAWKRRRKERAFAGT